MSASAMRVTVIVGLAVLVGALVAACGVLPGAAPATSTPTVAPTEPPATEPTGTEPAAGGIITSTAPIESIEILILESFPVQVNVVVNGYLPDACTEIAEINQRREGDTFFVDIITQRPADAVCAQVIENFQETVSLDVAGLPAGTYTVNVNGVTDTFTLEVDNVLPTESG